MLAERLAYSNFRFKDTVLVLLLMVVFVVCVNRARPLAFLANTWSAFGTTGLEIKKSKQREGGREEEKEMFCAHIPHNAKLKHASLGIGPGLYPMGWYHLYSGYIFPPQSNLSGNVPQPCSIAFAGVATPMKLWCVYRKKMAPLQAWLTMLLQTWYTPPGTPEMHSSSVISAYKRLKILFYILRKSGDVVWIWAW